MKRTKIPLLFSETLDNIFHLVDTSLNSPLLQHTEGGNRLPFFSQFPHMTKCMTHPPPPPPWLAPPAVQAPTPWSRISKGREEIRNAGDSLATHHWVGPGWEPGTEEGCEACSKVT